MMAIAFCLYLLRSVAMSLPRSCFQVLPVTQVAALRTDVCLPGNSVACGSENLASGTRWSTQLPLVPGLRAGKFSPANRHLAGIKTCLIESSAVRLASIAHLAAASSSEYNSGSQMQLQTRPARGLLTSGRQENDSP